MELDRRAYRILAWIGIAFIAAATVVVMLRGDWSGVAVLGAFLLASIALVAFEDRLPSLFDLLFVIAAMVNGAGWIWNLYKSVLGYDEFAHFFTTFAVALALGYLVLYVMREHFRAHRVHYAVIIISFGVTLGAWWEVFEWVILAKLTDPVGDIIVDTLGAVLAALLAVWALTQESGAGTSR